MSKPQTPDARRETHILSIRSQLDDVTIYLTPAKERGLVNVTLRINNDRYSSDLSCRIGAESLLLAATSLHAIINEVYPS
jgi:hypothetical protein